MLSSSTILMSCAPESAADASLQLAADLHMYITRSTSLWRIKFHDLAPMSAYNAALHVVGHQQNPCEAQTSCK